MSAKYNYKNVQSSNDYIGEMLFFSNIFMLVIVWNIVFSSAFVDYLENGGEVRFQELCNQITTEFSDCSKQVR